ncbi:MAG: hypothetical protein J0M12_08800 [Deltaproteobacteria bacterium]|nr:hypothetical protein [Deltaproteobacteria bacterium]
MKSRRLVKNELVLRNEAQWYVRLLRKDLEELRREHVHLRAKSKERGLTDWETQRIIEISREIISLLTRFKDLPAQPSA